MRKFRSVALSALAATAAGLAALAAPAPAQAREIAWCARTWSNGFNGDCMYYTYAQCRAAISGLRGDCVPNPFAANSFGRYEPPPRRHRPAHAHQRRPHHHHRH